MSRPADARPALRRVAGRRPAGRPAAVDGGRPGARRRRLAWIGGRPVTWPATRPTPSTGSGRSPRPSPRCWCSRPATTGLLALDEPLASYLPEAPFGDRPLRALLSHSAGVPGEPAGPWWERSTGGDFAALVEANRDQALATTWTPTTSTATSPTACSARSSPGCAATTGGRWCRPGSSTPLGMTRTTYQATAPHAQGYSVSHLLGTLTPEPHSDTGAMAPAGQMWSTVTDLATYADFVLRGHPDVLGLSTLEEAAVEQHPGSQYGLGFRTVARSPWPARRSHGHDAGLPGVVLLRPLDGDRFRRLQQRHDRPVVPRRWRARCWARWPRATRRCRSRGGRRPTCPTRCASWSASGTGARRRSRSAGTPASSGCWSCARRTAYEEYHREDRGWVGTDGTLLEVFRNADGSVSHLVSETYLFTRTPYDAAAPIPGGPRRCRTRRWCCRRGCVGGMVGANPTVVRL